MIIILISALKTIALGLISSIVASVIFWILSFRYSRTKVVFSEYITKSKNTGEYHGENRYQVKLINAGRQNLIEIAISARLSILIDGKSHNTYIGLGHNNTLPMLYGRKNWTNKKILPSQYPFIFTLHPIKETWKEFTKSHYSDAIREKAIHNELSLDDIFDAYGDTMTIRIFLFGNDGLTGARKVFSIFYTSANITHGSFCAYTPSKKRIHYSRFIQKTLSVQQNEINKIIAELKRLRSICILRKSEAE